MDYKNLFVEWLTAAAVEHTKKGSKMAMVYNRGLEKLRRVDHVTLAKELGKIQYIGDKTVAMLCSRLQAHCASEGQEMPPEFNYEKPVPKRPLDTDAGGRKRPKKAWVPKRRAGSWAILVALYLKDKTGRGLSKDEIIKTAAPYCDGSFVANPANHDFYLAWDGMKTLVNREYVSVGGHSPKLYLITEEGKVVALVILLLEGIASSPLREVHNTSYDNGVIFSSSSPVRGPVHDRQLRVYDGIAYDIWPAGDFEIFPVIDNREIRSQKERDFFHDRLQNHNIEVDVRALLLGDVVWLARNTHSGVEVVLDVICERKRMDDLASSIRDGRFHEQKSRLAVLGMSHIYYIVEEGGSDISDMVEALRTAMATTVVTLGFVVKRFRNIDATISFIASMTKALQLKYENCRLVVLKPRTVTSKDEFRRQLEVFRSQFDGPSCKSVQKFALFQNAMPKTGMMTVREMFLLMLMAVRGLSFEKALVIQRHFHTPAKLLEFYKRNQHLSESEKNNLLFDMFKGEISSKKIGKAVSQAVYQTWGT